VALLPVGVVAAGVGAAAAENPLAGLGLAGMAILAFLPWPVLFAAFVGSSVGNAWGVDVAGATLRAAQAVLVPFAIRAFLFTDRRARPGLGKPEAFLGAFIVANMISTFFFAPVAHSWLAVGILAFGATTYLAVYTSVCTPARLRYAARVFLLLGALSAGVGILCFAGYYVGTSYGIDFRYTPVVSGAPAVKGIAWEHDIFGSTCAAVAIAFFVLMRDHSRLFSPRWTARFFWMSTVGMVLSQARGAWLAFVLVTAGYWVLGSRRHRKRRPARMLRLAAVLAVVGFVGIGALYVAGQSESVSAPSPILGVFVSAGSKITNAFNFTGTASCGECNTTAARLRRLNKGFSEVMSSSPVIGLGTDSYGERNFRPSPYTFPYLAPGYIEVLYGRTIYDTGMVGILLLLGFIGTLMWPRRDILVGTGEIHRTARAILFAGISIAIAYGITDGTFFMWPWILFGLVRASVRLAREQEPALPVAEDAGDALLAASNGNATGNGHPNGKGRPVQGLGPMPRVGGVEPNPGT
jgi:hypothetical protein